MAARKKAVVTETGESAAQTVDSPFNRTLKYGADGDDVKVLQAALLAAGGDVAETGVYDLRTVRAVQRLQRQRGLPASGIIGKHDYAALLGNA
ncbi:MAG: peptidoglycan-binding domain-containing protein [Candidatus Limiplasma sp.]|nr:peptidoglycan-binding domain-containing protein [Candidatus Limiplasma sp.]MEA5146024.1 peptidoglycan-binding domain-containing protein [Candidatus Limiplasma sp.]